MRPMMRMPLAASLLLTCSATMVQAKASSTGTSKSSSSAEASTEGDTGLSWRHKQKLSSD